MPSRNVDEIIKQMKDDVAQPPQAPSEDKRARYEKHVAELAAESPEDLLVRYGVKPGDTKDLLTQLLDVYQAPIGAALYPEASTRDTAEEFRADIQQYAAAPKE